MRRLLLLLSLSATSLLADSALLPMPVGQIEVRNPRLRWVGSLPRLNLEMLNKTGVGWDAVIIDVEGKVLQWANL
jgi:hypothetical protein